MFKRIAWKRILYLFTWLICLGGVITLISFINVKKGQLRCKDIKVIIPGTAGFIDRKEVNRIIQEHSGLLMGKLFQEINTHKLEALLKKNPYIKDAEVFADMDGTVHIKVIQSEPILRVINYTNQNFYIDRLGNKLPPSMDYTPHVLVANGYIMESYTKKIDSLKTSIARDLYKTALYVEKDTLWRDQIEQLYVNQQNEIELVTRVGDQKIILGNADSLEVRFNNLKAFYKKAMPAVGWNAYKTINIKYTNQIICEKNLGDSSWIISAAIKKEQD
ncbi:Cell division protein FtsQ [Arcticibacter svalbardensis MN12-7]|uniref:Cell division protein FtsQ n=1 Tax=Arcticibacter svalbardensis MN12-7 TaxID=1150600 RepID=R9GYX1_9SPHI|nr:FtsQ-type POTRA domain-containing protein [Arcticibacter svalbardensis]EOR94144.1 Cell division protein FtsQ [Arcticibacter svalbardensis MN12-7]